MNGVVKREDDSGGESHQRVAGCRIRVVAANDLEDRETGRPVRIWSRAPPFFRLLLIQLVFVQGLAAESLPDEWWLRLPAQDVLARAGAITRDLSFYEGSKARLANNPSGSRVIMRRRLADGTIESKTVFHNGARSLTTFNLKSGTYNFVHGRLIKLEYERDQSEPSLAKRFDHPYDYRLMPAETVGTNDCIVVARMVTPEFLQALKATFYPGLNEKDSDSLLGNPADYIRCETDTYIRKTDGVILGEIEKSKAGTVLYDQLCESVAINRPIPEREFVLPDTHVFTATNEFQQLHFIASGNADSGVSEAQNDKWIRFVIIGFMVATLGLFCFLIKISLPGRGVFHAASGDQRKQQHEN